MTHLALLFVEGLLGFQVKRVELKLVSLSLSLSLSSHKDIRKSLINFVKLILLRIFPLQFPLFVSNSPVFEYSFVVARIILTRPRGLFSSSRAVVGNVVAMFRTDGSGFNRPIRSVRSN